MVKMNQNKHDKETKKQRNKKEPFSTHMVYDSPTRKDPQDIDFKQKTTPHPMVSLATKPNQPHPVARK